MTTDILQLRDDLNRWYAERAPVRHYRQQRAIMALRELIRARDYHAEHGHYPPGTVGRHQSFDDWAADLAHDALHGANQ